MLCAGAPLALLEVAGQSCPTLLLTQAAQPAAVTVTGRLTPPADPAIFPQPQSVLAERPGPTDLYRKSESSASETSTQVQLFSHRQPPCKGLHPRGCGRCLENCSWHCLCIDMLKKFMVQRTFLYEQPFLKKSRFKLQRYVINGFKDRSHSATRRITSGS